VLTDYDLIQCIRDEGSYFGQESLIGIHIDNFLAVGKSKNLDYIVQGIQRHVELDKQGRPQKMLWIEMTWKKNSSRVLLTQSGLIENLAKKHGKVGIKTSMPLMPHYFSTITQMDTLCDNMMYQQIVGGLLYLSRMTRPEASIQVNLLERRSTNPSTMNLEGAKDLLRYFISTKMEGIQINKPENLNIVIYADAKQLGQGIKQSNDNCGRPTHELMDPKAECHITLDHGSRIYCGLRGSKGCRCNETIDIGDEDRHQYPNTDNGLRWCFKLVKNLEVPTTVETYRAQIPLPKAGDQ
jgi:hypothetical protein